MAKLDEESEELHQKFLKKDIDLPTFVQKYKKLRTTYHKQALLHLAGQTSLCWIRPWSVCQTDDRGNFVVYLLAHSFPTLCLALFLSAACVGFAKHQTETACIVMFETFYLGCRGTRLDLYEVIKPIFPMYIFYEVFVGMFVAT